MLRQGRVDVVTRKRHKWRWACAAVRGFALIEVVVAVAIFAMIGTLVFGTFARAMDARTRAEELTNHYHQVRQAMLRMGREIASSFVSTHWDCADRRTETLFKSGRSSGGMRLDFTSFSHFKVQADANESDQHEIGYFVDRHPDDSRRYALFRRHQGRIDDDADEGGSAQVLAEDVTDLQFSFYDAKDDRWIDEWDTTDSSFKDRLPMFVAIIIETIGPDGEKETFVTKTRVFLQNAIKILGTGFSGCAE